jgi:hypothetical protein
VKKSVLMASAILALVVAAPASASTGLGGWWPFYEGSGTAAHDLSGNGDNGSISGGAQWVSGYFGPGLQFDGSTGRVDVPNSSALEPANAVTVAAYVKSTRSPGDFKYILAKGAMQCLAASYALYTGPDGGLVFYVSQSLGSTYVLSSDPGPKIWDGKWHFVVGTYDSSAVHLYVDGAEVGPSQPFSGPIGYGMLDGNDLFIGHYDGCSGFDFSGAVDEPTVWSKAWSPSQVELSYRILTGLHGLISRLPSFPS